jgi:hypothetical protein
MLTPRYGCSACRRIRPFGTGDATGSLLPMSLLAKIAGRDADRKVTAKGKLTEPVDPVPSVTPLS